MTDQPTTTEQAMTAEPATTERVTTERATREQATTTEQPMGTRELRDAQASGEQAPAETKPRRAAGGSSQQRPPIRATGETAAGGTASSPTAAATRENAPLFDDAAGKQLRERWLVIQTEFVDEPHAAVEKADALVAEVLKRLTDTFASEREELEAGWSGSTDDSKREISTEELRQAIQRYRSFFNRLLAL